MADRSSFTVDSMIRGYHAYQEIWEAAIGEELPCQREVGNLVDPFAVAVVKDDTVVGHVPRKISSICSLFLQRHGSIVCQVTGGRFSRDLPQGGMEVPCLMTFEGEAKRTDKAKKLIENAAFKTSHTTNSDTEPPSKKYKIEKPSYGDTGPSNSETSWVQLGGILLTRLDRQEILNGCKLNDLMINAAQQLLMKQFPRISGLQSTLLQSRKRDAVLMGNNCVQVVHSRGDHWIVASTVEAPSSVVKIYDSIYDHLDKGTTEVIGNLFGNHTIELVPINKQIGGSDCGLFTISIATALCFGIDPAHFKFNQALLRDHFISCLENELFSLFPIA